MNNGGIPASIPEGAELKNTPSNQIETRHATPNARLLPPPRSNLDVPRKSSSIPTSACFHNTMFPYYNSTVPNFMPFPAAPPTYQNSPFLYNYYNPIRPPFFLPMYPTSSLMPQQPLLAPQQISYASSSLNLAGASSSLTRPSSQPQVPLPSNLPIAHQEDFAQINLTAEDPEICEVLKDYTASKYRYVYKCIVRHMNVYIRKNRDDIVDILSKLQYTIREIEHAFFTIGCQSENVGKKGCDKTSLAIINKMISTKSIYTYVLRETLYAILQNWKKGKTGKIAGKNIKLYEDACQKFYDETVRVLGQAAQGNNFLL